MSLNTEVVRLSDGVAVLAELEVNGCRMKHRRGKH